MDRPQRILHELQSKVDQNNQIIEQQTLQLGENLVGLKSAAVKKTLLKDQYLKARELVDTVREDRLMIKQLNDLKSQIEEIDSNLRAIRPGVSEKEREIESHLEEVGESSFKAYKSHPEKEDQFHELFTDIADHEEEIQKIERRLAELEKKKNKEPLFNKALDRSRAVFLYGQLKAKQFQRARIYRQVGKRICESEFLAEVDDADLSRLMAPVEATREGLGRSKKEEETLSHKKISLQQEMKSLVEEGGLRKPERQLVKDIRKVETQLSDLYRTLGKLYIDNPLHEELTNKVIDSKIEKIALLKNENKEHEARIERLKAGIEIERIEDKITHTQHRIGNLKAEIQRKNEELDKLNNSVTQMEEEKKQLLIVRGPEKTLLRQGSSDTAEGGPVVVKAQVDPKKRQGTTKQTDIDR